LVKYADIDARRRRVKNLNVAITRIRVLSGLEAEGVRFSDGATR